MIRRITTGWTAMRVLYAVLGVSIAVHSGIVNEWWAMGIGIYFASMGLFGLGCAGGQCAVPQQKSSQPGPETEKQ
jgi:hypothetical protein